MWKWTNEWKDECKKQNRILYRRFKPRQAERVGTDEIGKGKKQTKTAQNDDDDNDNNRKTPDKPPPEVASAKKSGGDGGSVRTLVERKFS